MPTPGQMWFHVAKVREAEGNKAGAEQARKQARVYSGRRPPGLEDHGLCEPKRRNNYRQGLFGWNGWPTQ